jgi:glycosyltransferase involved in cell wall biosynthesis
MRAGLSVTLIVLNEEARIRACLESVRWADEIVVCDSGSADRTREIVREYTDRLYVDAWRGFAAHKNLALERARQPWVLSLDADERVPAPLREEILAVLERDGPRDAYYVPRRNHFLGRPIRRCGWWPDLTLRLFRRGRGRFAPRSVHEAVVVEGRVGYLGAPLEHFTYDSVGAFLQRMDRYSTLAAQELRAAGRRARLPDVVARPAWTFLRMVCLQGGWREGWRGVVLSGLYASYTFSKYAKLWELERGRPDG